MQRNSKSEKLQINKADNDWNLSIYGEANNKTCQIDKQLNLEPSRAIWSIDGQYFMVINKATSINKLWAPNLFHISLSRSWSAALKQSSGQGK